MASKTSNCNNPFESVISSFEKACAYVENTSALKVMEIKKQSENDITSAEEVISEFCDGVSYISSTSDKLLQNEAIMKELREEHSKNIPQNNSIILSHHLQTDTINSIKEMYSFNLPFTETTEEKLLDKTFEETSDSVRKVILRTINQANSVKNTLLVNMRLTDDFSI